tara:strand:- start:646 stop:1431 length:786 start_codon:yes stop_codon:yes gene_type:complete
MANNKHKADNFADLVARLNAMSNMTPEEERASLMEAASSEPKVLDDKEVSLSDIAKLAGIKEYVEPVKVSKKAEKLVESITSEEPQSSITKAIKESDADDSISTGIKKAVNEEAKRLDKIAELELQLAELKAQEKEDATMDDKAFREVFTKEMTEYVKEAEAEDLVELYNKFSANEVDMNENSFIIKTPETTEIIADAEKEIADAEEEVVAEKEPEAQEPAVAEEPTEAPAEPIEEEGEEVELEMPAEDKFTNDLDPSEKK